MKICIDAGHGGSDPGAVAADGTKEKDVALMYAKRLEKELRDAGHDVKMVRTNDDFVGLTLRANKANDWGADCFVSLHANASSRASAQGAWVIYDDKTAADAGKALAASIFRELEAAGLADSDAEAEVFPDGSPWVGGRQLAVLSRTKMPAVLVELGFLTNPGDLSKLKDPMTAGAAVRAVRDGVLKWAKLPAPEVEVVDPGVDLSDPPVVRLIKAPAREVAKEGEPAGLFSVRTLRLIVESQEAQSALSKMKAYLIAIALDWVRELLEDLLRVEE